MKSKIDKSKARRIFTYALQSGKIRSKKCEECGEEKTEGHHKDYSQPLKVKWFCRTHHKEWHMNNKSPKGVNSEVLVLISRDTRAELKILAAVSGMTIKDFLAQVAKEKKAESRGYK